MNPPSAAGEIAAARVCAFATAAFLVLAPASSSPGVRIALLSVAALALAHVAFHYGRERLAGPLPGGVVAAYAAWSLLACASLLWSVNPAYTRAELKPELLYGALAFAVFFYGATSHAAFRLCALALLAGTALLAVADFAHAIVRPAATPWHGGPGRFSTHLVIAAPFLAALALPRPWGLGRHPAWLAAGLAVFFAAALATQNRITWLAFLVSLSVLALALGPSFAARARRGWLAGAAALVVAIGLLAALSFVQKAEDSYPNATSTGESLSMDLRPRLWLIARDAIAERPLQGYGFGREILIDRFRERIGEKDRQFATHGHNMFVNAALSLGLPGALLLAALMAALGIAHARSLRREDTRLAGAIGLAILGGFLAKNLTDDFFARHNALVFWAVNGLLLGLGRRPPGADR